MRLSRVIFASDLNANYIQFWGLSSRVWYQVTGARPTLFLVAPSNTIVEQLPFADVVHIPPPPDIPSCFVAQMVRLLAPLWYPQEVCVISDIDLLMVSRQFFPSYLLSQDNAKLVILNRYTPDIGRPSLSYHVATGNTFAELWGVPAQPVSQEHLWQLLRSLYKQYQGQWSTDELLLAQMVAKFRQKQAHRVVEHFTPHLWRQPKFSVTHYNRFQFDPRLAAQYIEVEPPAPYTRHRQLINRVVGTLVPTLTQQLDTFPIVQVGVVQANRHPHKASTGQLPPPPAPLVPRRPKRFRSSRSHK